MSAMTEDKVLDITLQTPEWNDTGERVAMFVKMTADRRNFNGQIETESPQSVAPMRRAPR